MRAILLLCSSVIWVGACVGDSTVPPDAGPDVTTMDVVADAGCGNTMTDPNNCGACGHTCATGFNCTQGRCDNAVAELGAGSNHTCVALNNGQVWCWGVDDVGQAGQTPTASIPPTFIPRDVASNTLSGIGFGGGFNHMCTVRATTEVSCWGNNQFGQLTGGFISLDGGPVPNPTPSNPIAKNGKSLYLTSLGHGPTASHTCGVNDGGVVYCWGDDTYGETTALDASVPQSCNNGQNQCIDYPTVALSTAVAQVAVGNGFTCTLDGSGVVQCWGTDYRGQLGNGRCGKCFNCTAPSPITLSGPASYVATGDTNACAVIASDGSVACWGINESGQLGHMPTGADGGLVDVCCDLDCGYTLGHPQCEPSPVVVPGITNASAVAIGAAHVCALVKDGSVWCWGANDKGQLGRGSNDTNPSPVPAKITALTTKVTQIAAGANHTCALLADGTVWCWGLNNNGQLGMGTANANAPVQVTTLPH